MTLRPGHNALHRQHHLQRHQNIDRMIAPATGALSFFGRVARQIWATGSIL